VTTPDETTPGTDGGLKNGGRGEPPVIVRRVVSIQGPVIGLVLAGIAFATLLLWALAPSDNDGASQFVGFFGVPMVVTSIIIQIIAHLWVHRHEKVRFTFLWWPLLVMPLALLAAGVPAILADPDYFEASTVGGALAALGGFVFLMVLGFGFGALLWFFVVMPLSQIVVVIGRMLRGERAAHGLILPGILLVLAAIILLGTGAVDLSEAGPGRFAWPAIVAALLGLPGEYRVQSELALWIVRVLVLGVILAFILTWRYAKKAAAEESVDDSSAAA
jgi:hypothetical protein